MTGQKGNLYAALDIETRGLIKGGVNPPILCVSVATDNGSECIPWSEEVPSILNSYLTNFIPIFHNASFDVRILRDAGVDINHYVDTMIMSYVWNPSGQHSLQTWGIALGFPKLQKPWEGHYPEEYTPELEAYCVRDAELTLTLFYHLRELYKDDVRASELCKSIEIRFCDIIMEMESTGLYVDTSKLQELSTSLQTSLADIETELTTLCPIVPNKSKYLVNKKEDPNWVYVGEEEVDGRVKHKYKQLELFSPTKAAHKIYLLENLYGWKPTHLTEGGQVATSAEVLETLPKEWKAVQLLLDHAELNKIHSTYIEPFTNLGVSKGNEYVVYGNFNQCVTVTGRLSSSKPNLQNIPRRGVWGDRMRDLIIAPEGHTIVNGDLSNIEARILAFVLYKVCSDTSLMDVFISGGDFHTYNQERWHLDSRDTAKAVLFSIIYGAGASSVAARIGKSKQDVELILAQVEESTPSISEAKERLIRKTKKQKGLIHTLFGRRLYYPAINSKDSAVRSRAERQLFNAIIQGTSADILKKLSLIILPYLRRSCARIALELHDEVLIYCPPDSAEQLVKELNSVFSWDLLYPVPIEAKFRTGNTWKDAH